MLNPKLADGTPVMMGFDSHHPSCFTFPSEGKDSEKVTCPENALGILNDCRGSKLYLAKSETGCVCVPVSGDAPSEMACPDGIETER